MSMSARQQRSHELLRALYNAVEGRLQVSHRVNWLFETCQLSPDEGEGHLLYLAGKGYLMVGDELGARVAQLTVRGIDAAEAAADGSTAWIALTRTPPQADPATVDGLTMLYRKEVFTSDVPQAVEGARGSRQPLVLLMLDLDDFKKLNDTHGHPAGDEVLRAAADVLKRCVGEKGRAYRYGGEEMAGLLPNYSVDEATALAERARRELEAQVIGEKGITVTASIGVACVPVHAITATELVDRADRALYAAKHGGRNCVSVSGEPAPSAEPRRVVRKAPSAQNFTPEEISTIRGAYFLRRTPVCPRDGGILEILTYEALNAADVRFITVHCPRCRLREDITPD